MEIQKSRIPFFCVTAILLILLAFVYPASVKIYSLYWAASTVVALPRVVTAAHLLGGLVFQILFLISLLISSYSSSFKSPGEAIFMVIIQATVCICASFDFQIPYPISSLHRMLFVDPEKEQQQDRRFSLGGEA